MADAYAQDGDPSLSLARLSGSPDALPV